MNGLRNGNTVIKWNTSKTWLMISCCVISCYTLKMKNWASVSRNTKFDFNILSSWSICSLIRANFWYNWIDFNETFNWKIENFSKIDSSKQSYSGNIYVISDKNIDNINIRDILGANLGKRGWGRGTSKSLLVVIKHDSKIASKVNEINPL